MPIRTNPMRMSGNVLMCDIVRYVGKEEMGEAL
jgi:hypothetical protein